MIKIYMMNIAVKTTAQNHNILNIYALPLNNLLYYVAGIALMVSLRIRNLLNKDFFLDPSV